MLEARNAEECKNDLVHMFENCLWKIDNRTVILENANPAGKTGYGTCQRM